VKRWKLYAGGALAAAAACAPQGAGDRPRSGIDPIRVEGELPCDVEKILANVCQYCHTSPPRNGAPFPLVTYSDTQQRVDGRPIYEYMGIAVGMGRMPLAPMSLTADERAVLVAWSTDGGQRRPDGASCTAVDAGPADAREDVKDGACDATPDAGPADAGGDADEDAG
jgi:hypothetical protein